MGCNSVNEYLPCYYPVTRCFNFDLCRQHIILFAGSYFHRMNGYGAEARAATPAQADTIDAPLGGLFAKLAKQQGGPPRLPAFPVMFDMSSTKV